MNISSKVGDQCTRLQTAITDTISDISSTYKELDEMVSQLYEH
jgi:hypothetical protein